MLRGIKIRTYLSKAQTEDLNAAKNILKEGGRIIGSRRPEFTLAESPTVDDRQAEPDLRSGGSLKQEAETWKT